MSTENDLRARAARWAAEDLDDDARTELEKLLAASDLARTDLADRFAGDLEFGTAGLRGLLGAGPNRMNRAVVVRTTWGLARHLLEANAGAGAVHVVIGYDGRAMSRVFAEETACVLAAAGIRASLFAEVAPTPLTAFAVRELGAAAGVMITASHNPPAYNGYKVYWNNGAQIIPPVDAAIAAQIARAPVPREVPRMALADARATGLVIDAPPSVERSYLDRVRALQVHPELPPEARAFEIVYTPLHGVGDKLARLALAEAGFTHVTSVPEQQHPDAAFPTVAFPNPEEKGAMDHAFALARARRAELVLANDPDADRLAVAVPHAGNASGYVQFTGNQVGVLLGHYLLTEGRIHEGRGGGKDRLVLASIVSSPMLGGIARALGIAYEGTLTGFKWIANRAIELESPKDPNEVPKRFVFGYEEALGYTVRDVVRDKDGISAAVLFAELAAWAASRGSSVLAELEAIYRRYGLFVSSQVNLTRPGAGGAAEIRARMEHLRRASPRRIGAHDVVAVCDYAAQTRTDFEAARTTRLPLPASNVLAFELAGSSRVIARPSGTEPKVKFYFDVREELRPGEALADAEARANAAMAALANAFMELATAG